MGRRAVSNIRKEKAARRYDYDYDYHDHDYHELDFLELPDLPLSQYTEEVYFNLLDKDFVIVPLIQGIHRSTHNCFA